MARGQSRDRKGAGGDSQWDNPTRSLTLAALIGCPRPFVV